MQARWNKGPNQQAERQVGENTQLQQQNKKIINKKRQKKKKPKGRLRELQDIMKCNNIHIIGISEGEERDQGLENLLKKY